jgi:hypothetical protein
MSEYVEVTEIQTPGTQVDTDEGMMEQVIPVPMFLEQFGDGLLDAVSQQNPPVYRGEKPQRREQILADLNRRPFDEQAEAVHAVTQLLLDKGEPAAVINGEMGTGKTMMGIAAAALLHHHGLHRCLVLSPPHLVYKWRREIIQTVPGAKVWVLNGPDTLRKLLQIRQFQAKPADPEFFVLGRVRMRMGFNWAPAFSRRVIASGDGISRHLLRVACCSSCGEPITDGDGQLVQVHIATVFLDDTRKFCANCKTPLWSLVRGKAQAKSRSQLVLDALTQIPTIGEKSAARLLSTFGEDMLANMLEDNFHNFINLMDGDGDLIFSDRQAKRMERYLGNNEISFGQGGYQPTEFIKRYLPQGFFGCLLVDEGHEYKNEGSAQGQAMGVLASQAKKTILLTGTLMGGYADDLFHLLYRMNPHLMVSDGFRYNKRGSIGPAADAFMKAHGVLIDTYKSSGSEDSRSHRTAKGDNITRHTSKGPGFGPKGIMRYVVPITAFIKLRDIKGNVLPPYVEEFREVVMDEQQSSAYQHLSLLLKESLKRALLAGDHSLLGVVLNCLLAWPDTAFRPETVLHPHRRTTLASVPALYGDSDTMPKEAAVLDFCRQERREGRRVLVYTTYTGTRDTTARFKRLLEQSGFKVAVLRASVEAAKREDWVADQVDRGIDVVITNPELVKTGLDLLEFPSIAFMQTGYNVYTLQQAARRSWRIGQRKPVKVVFFGYAGTAQQECLKLMAKKIAVSQSTSGDMPESGLDVLNQDGDSIEVALAKQLVDKEAV